MKPVFRKTVDSVQAQLNTLPGRTVVYHTRAIEGHQPPCGGKPQKPVFGKQQCFRRWYREERVAYFFKNRYVVLRIYMAGINKQEAEDNTGDMVDRRPQVLVVILSVIAATNQNCKYSFCHSKCNYSFQ